MKSPRAYYNENNAFAAQWIRNLIVAGHIAPGDVDERDIRDVRPDDLKGYTQCHFFAGIGVWSLALRNAGFPDSRRAWTGSCPCQPWSNAGKREGVNDDERHLWPAWFKLIDVCRPSVIIGEQVASAHVIGRSGKKHGPDFDASNGPVWLDIVFNDLERPGYACGAVVFPACGVGAPHIRQRLSFVATLGLAVAEGGVFSRLADSECRGCTSRSKQFSSQKTSLSTAGINVGGLADIDGGLSGHGHLQRSGEHGQQPQDRGSLVEPGHPGPTDGFWRDVDWLYCRDGKWRPVESRTFPLAHGIAGRVGKLRAFGNAIVEPQQRAFIEAFLESEDAGHIPHRGLGGLTPDVEDLIG